MTTPLLENGVCVGTILSSSRGGMGIDPTYPDSTMGGMGPDYVAYQMARTPGFVPPTNAQILADPDLLAAYQHWWRRYEAGEFVLRDGYREDVRETR